MRYGIDGATDQAFDERKDGLRDGKEQSYKKRLSGGRLEAIQMHASRHDMPLW